MKGIGLIAVSCMVLATSLLSAGNPPTCPNATRIEGVIASIDAQAKQLVVGETTVSVTDSTLIKMRGRTITFAELAVGQTVAVCGTLADGVLTAKTITVKYGGSLALNSTRVEGAITAVDGETMQIVVNGVVVQITDDTLIIKKNRAATFADFAVDQNVAACGELVDGVLVAQRVTIRR